MVYCKDCTNCKIYGVIHGENRYACISNSKRTKEDPVNGIITEYANEEDCIVKNKNLDCCDFIPKTFMQRNADTAIIIFIVFSILSIYLLAKHSC